jgi:hypothetical protein
MVGNFAGISDALLSGALSERSRSNATMAAANSAKYLLTWNSWFTVPLDFKARFTNPTTVVGTSLVTYAHTNCGVWPFTS